MRTRMDGRGCRSSQCGSPGELQRCSACKVHGVPTLAAMNLSQLAVLKRGSGVRTWTRSPRGAGRKPPSGWWEGVRIGRWERICSIRERDRETSLAGNWVRSSGRFVGRLVRWWVGSFVRSGPFGWVGWVSPKSVDSENVQSELDLSTADGDNLWRLELNRTFGVG